MSATADLKSLPGVGPATADKLLDAGYEDFKAIAVSSPGELSNEADIGKSTANDIIQAAREAADVGGFETGTEVKNRRKEHGAISFRIDELDGLLGGEGVQAGDITEFYGEFGAGKSQVTHQMVVNVQLLPEHGGLDQAAMFIDTEDTFRPTRIADMVEGLDDEVLETEIERRDVEVDVDGDLTPLVESFLNDIHVAKAFNSNHQILLAEKAKEKASEAENNDDTRDIGLVVVDSLTAHFRAEYVGRGELAERQQKLNKHIHDLIRVADLHNCVAMVTNQVASNPDSYFGDPTQPIGGNILGHASCYRFYIRKSKGEKRVFKLDDAPEFADGEAVCKVTGDGLVPE